MKHAPIVTAWDVAKAKRSADGYAVEQAEREAIERRRVIALLQAHPNVGMTMKGGYPMYYAFPPGGKYLENRVIDNLLEELANAN